MAEIPELLTKQELALRIPGFTERHVQHLVTMNHYNFRRCVVQTGPRKRLYDLHRVLAWLEEHYLGEEGELQPVAAGEVGQ
jgi:hypothetical protein